MGQQDEVSIILLIRSFKLIIGIWIMAVAVSCSTSTGENPTPITTPTSLINQGILCSTEQFKDAPRLGVYNLTSDWVKSSLKAPIGWGQVKSGNPSEISAVFYETNACFPPLDIKNIDHVPWDLRPTVAVSFIRFDNSILHKYESLSDWATEKSDVLADDATDIKIERISIANSSGEMILKKYNYQGVPSTLVTAGILKPDFLCEISFKLPDFLLDSRLRTFQVMLDSLEIE